MRILLFCLVFSLCASPLWAETKAPNVLLIITDDQGYGDMGHHGNPKIQTPHLDRFAKESTQLTRFYVCPVCSPTRSALLTGRYTYRTGVVDTFIGRSMMYTEEVTLAEMLQTQGYRTGIFGKWHLGDCYPMRPQDQGFDEVLVHRGGGIGQSSDPPGGESYFDPILSHNGKLKKCKGYCSDVYTDAVLEFITQKSDKPFFTYLAYNAPHTPLQVAEEELKPYQAMNLDFDQFPQLGYPLPKNPKKNDTARIYAMVSNIDRNLGRIFAKLEETKIAQDTIVIFLTDNGPQQVRWNAGFRGQKGSVYEGGIRVPFYIRWPGKIPADKKVDLPTAHIDVVPTLLDACQVPVPTEVKLDGRSVWDVLLGKKKNLPERTYFVQWHRGNVPDMHRACAAIGERYKIAQPLGVQPNSKWPDPPVYQLLDLQQDPYEQTDLAHKHPELVQKLKAEYEAWFTDMKKTRDFVPPRIHLGSEKEPITVLTPQDWRIREEEVPPTVGAWDLFVLKPCRYNIRMHFNKNDNEGEVHIKIQNQFVDVTLKGGKSAWFDFDKLDLENGNCKLEAWIMKDGKRVSPKFVEMKLIKE